MTAIHVACSADARFVHDCGVMLRSLMTANAGESITIHFLYDEKLPAGDLQGLAETVESFGGDFAPFRLGSEERKDFPFTDRFGYNAWYRVLAPRLFPDLERILYLDSDLLILGRLRPLWETPLGDKVLAAVTQPIPDDMVSRVRETLGLPSREEYFNSGVMLLDLRALRRQGSVEQVLAFVRDRRAPMPWADQDPLNAVLYDQRLRLHPRWNVMTPMFERTPLPPFTGPELDEARARPEIVHFIGEYKPLHFRSRHPYRRMYFEHLRQTAWRDRKVYGHSIRHFLLRYLPWSWQHRVDALWLRGYARLARIFSAAS